mmetsp:Transcript_47998/g.120790  ORF Transcript_47998/g.120790 Transcript_47998/m.120790 type:complete len:290 (+) Transcript_47998:152-1021(+)
MTRSAGRGRKFAFLSRYASSMTAAAMMALTSRIRLRLGYRQPTSRSSGATVRDSACAATANMRSVTSVAWTSSTPRPTPGKMYALLPCPGTYRTPLCSPAGMGDPDAYSTRPSVHCMACAAVHSALDVGLDSAKMTGRSLLAAISRQMPSVNTPAIADTPISTLGFSVRTASSSEPTSGWSCAYSSLWCASFSLRDLTTSPTESKRKMRFRASSTGMPSSKLMASEMRFAMPTPASPAPLNRKVLSLNFLLVIFFDDRMPDNVTAAVPWMSSLKVTARLRYFSSRRKAF